MKAIAGYDAQGAELAARYEQLRAEDVHAAFLSFLPTGPDKLALDIGAGSGRDAAWLTRMGFDVVAVEPARGMRDAAGARHGKEKIRWLDDRLPALAATHRLGLAFDVVLLSGVFMHIPPDERPRAFRKIVTLLKPGGRLLISVRNGSGSADRPMWPVARGELESYARSHGLAILQINEGPDLQARQDVHWTSYVLQLPDDGAGSLPLLRGIILNDDKSATYKLGLLRAIARIADTAPALAIDRADADVVDLPLGAVALNWLRMYLPLAAADLPQLPGNRGADRLGFAGAAFRQLLADRVAGQDLRIGARFTGERAAIIARALADARTNICRMPANFIRYPNSETRVFDAAPARAPRIRDDLVLDMETLRGFGTITVPGPVWRTLQRLGAWVEPVLVSEWSRLIEGFALRSGRVIVPGETDAALRWLDPARDTTLARETARRLIANNRPVHCVWTGGRLSLEALDIDHCLPWTAWPCGDLWNLFPARATVNRNAKRDRLPSAAALAAARDGLQHWWRQAWEADEALAQRFWREVEAALPVGRIRDLDDVFSGLEWRRLRLRQDQQVQEWAGV
ncbi:methyltransferase domain-containing protein [Brevundimonas sp. A19_0]|uniref:methyltransferase domain-containing protein n=1 Tax=Brevundimonas sp. A19_0 TaxID=2821087 RepID=UPI001AD9EB2E|nr:methyltransferase domain-containing protein [Brevundimonas sp. A19_0]MBO9501635.1 methyltransferase domain-containing protein [Brevundimonas sp. A19_0]